MPSRARAVALLSIAVLAAGCDVTLPWSDGDAAQTGGGGTLAVSPPALTFTAEPGGPTPPAETLTVTVTGTVYVDVQWSGAAIFNASFSVTGPTTGQIQVFPSPTGTTASARSGTVTVIGCADEACTRQIAGSPVTVPVTFDVAASSLQASPSALSFAYTQGGALPPGQVVSLSDSAGSTGAWSVTVIHPTGATGWLRISPGTGTLPATPTISIAPQPTIAVGTHAAVAIFASPGGERRVNVTLEVTRPGLAVSASTVGFASFVGEAAAPAPRSVDVTETGGAAVAFTATVTYLVGGSGWLAPIAAGTTPATVALAPAAAATVAGTRSARVTFHPSDGGASANVDVSYTASPPGIEVSPAALALQAYAGQSPAPGGTLDLATDLGTVAFATSTTYGPGATGWLGWAGTSPAPATLAVSANTTVLAPGAYTATLRVTPSNGAPAVNVPVTYDVLAAPLSATPSAASFGVTAATTPAEISAPVTLSSTAGAVSWSASSDAAWLAVSPASGVTTTEPVLTLTLVPGELGGLANAAHAAEVTVAYDVGGSAVNLVIPVTLALDLPRVSFVTPSTVVAGSTEEVIVRGEGLAGVEGRDLLFGASAIPAPAPASATELRLVPPAGLAAGSHLVAVENGLGIEASRARLTVVDPVTFAAASVATTGAKGRLLYDDARGAAWASNASQGLVERFTTTPSGWVRDTITLAGVDDIAFSPDGTRVVAVAGTGVYEIDPDAATPSATAVVASGLSASDDHRLGFANDGIGVLVKRNATFYCARYDFLARRLLGTAGCPSVYSAGIGASGDGRRVVLTTSGLSPAPPIRWYDASAAAFAASATTAGASWVAVDRTGTRVLLLSDFYSYVPSYSNEVHDAAGALLGRLEPTTARALLSPDGARAYAFDHAAGRVRTYDLAAAPVSGVFPELGTAGGAIPTASPGAHAGVRMALSADGRTLFLAGDAAFVVFPLP